jgi:hypothetical protein
VRFNNLCNFWLGRRLFLLFEFPQALASGQISDIVFGFSQSIRLKPKSYNYFNSPAKAGGNSKNFHPKCFAFANKIRREF